jgi:hypothetical protein
VGRFEAIASHLKNNVAKMPAGTLLQNIGNGVFLFGRKEINHGITNNGNGKRDKAGTEYPMALTVQSFSSCAQ